MKKSPFQRATSKLAPILLSLGMAVSATAEQFKVATVNMTTLLNEYHKTKAAEKEEGVGAESIRKLDSERISSIQAMIAELRNLQKQLEDPSLSVDKKKEIAKVGQDRQVTLQGLQKEREEFLGRSRRALSAKMVGMMNEIRAEVMKAVNEYAATVDANFVFDDSGLTTNQVPFLVYVRNKDDITAAVLKKLNAGAK